MAKVFGIGPVVDEARPALFFTPDAGTRQIALSAQARHKVVMLGADDQPMRDKDGNSRITTVTVPGSKPTVFAGLTVDADGFVSSSMTGHATPETAIVLAQEYSRAIQSLRKAGDISQAQAAAFGTDAREAFDRTVTAIAASRYKLLTLKAPKATK